MLVAASEYYDGHRRGVGYVYRRADGAWVQEARLQAESFVHKPAFPTIYSPYSASTPVALSDRFAVLGTAEYDYPAPWMGSLYVFERVGLAWGPPQQLVLDAPQPKEFFGNGVALAGEWLFASSTRGVHVFRHHEGTGWVQEQVLEVSGAYVHPSTVSDQHAVGFEFDADGERVVVGAATYGHPALAGGVYVFKRTEAGWVQEALITRPRVQASRVQYFGKSVSLSGTRLAIGDVRGGPNGYGEAYVYELDGEAWVERGTLRPSVTPSQSFGESIVIQGDTVFVADTRRRSTGAVDVFSAGPTGWIPVLEITSVVASPGYDLYSGMGLDADDGYLFIGTPGENVGRVRVYRLGLALPVEPSPARTLALSTPTPNPLVSVGALSLSVPSAQGVTAALYDVVGCRLRTLHDGPLWAGAHRLAVDAGGLAPGVYFVRATGETFNAVRPLTVAR